MPRDETAQRANDWSPNRYQGDKHIHQRTIPSHGQTAFTQSSSALQHSGAAVDSQPYFTIPGQGASSTRHPEPPEVLPRRRVSADQIYAAHREARLEARQALKEEAHTEGLLKSRKAVLPSEIRRRERSVDDPNRGHESFSPEQQRRSRVEEDWDREYLRERGRERTVQRIRERVRDFPNREPQGLQHGPSAQRQHDDSALEHSREQDDLRTYVRFEHPQDPLRPQERDLQRPQHEYELQRQELLFQEQKCRQEPHFHDNSDTLKQQHPDSSPQQSFDSAVYLQRGDPSIPQAKHRDSESSGPPKSKIRTRSMSDIGISQHSTKYRMERAAGGKESTRGGHPPAPVNGEHSLGGALDTRVSVAQLRHSYLENANRKPDV